MDSSDDVDDVDVDDVDVDDVDDSDVADVAVVDDDDDVDVDDVDNDESELELLLSSGGLALTGYPLILFQQIQIRIHHYQTLRV